MLLVTIVVDGDDLGAVRLGTRERKTRASMSVKGISRRILWVARPAGAHL